MSTSDTRKIDIFSHILPQRYKDALYKKAKDCYYLEADLERPALFDLDIRFRVMDKFEGLRQVLTIGAPPIEYVVNPDDAVNLSKLANDEMAELVSKYPERFAAGVACLPMNDMDAALTEAERAINDLHLKGIQLYSSINGKPLDRPEFMPLYEMMEKFDMPIWIHPARDISIPDYSDEKDSKHHAFVRIGWPYQTSLAMLRLVFGGVLEKYENIKFIAHHCGAMIPFFEQRIASGGPGGVGGQPLSKPIIEYFKRFYADTVLSGSSPGLMCGHAFFGPDHMLFASDYPYPGGAKKGDFALAKEIRAVEMMDVLDNEKNKIFWKNAEQILKL